MNHNIYELSIQEVKEDLVKSELIYRRGNDLVKNEMCTLVGEVGNKFDFLVEDRFSDFKVVVEIDDNSTSYSCDCASHLDCCHHAAAALIKTSQILEERGEAPKEIGAYSRKEMIKRVLDERKKKASNEEYKIKYADNIYGIHKVKTKFHKVYKVTIRDFEAGNGYCSCPDYKTNKLGTCKHLIYAIEKVKSDFPITKLAQSQKYPFVEIFCDPFYDYNISYFAASDTPPEISELLANYFGSEQYILEDNYPNFLQFLNKADEEKQILVRPEVVEKIDKYFEVESINRLSKTITPDFTKIKAELFDYQKEGILFSLFKKGNIIADEMGLGKTLQAIAIAIFKKDIYNFEKVLIVAPSSLKYQWKKEIEKFSDETVEIVEGTRDERHKTYKMSKSYFLIANYEAVLRDVTVIKNYPPDMVILDEAQKIKNYDTKTSSAVKSIPKKHALVITGTPLENRLLDLYSIMNFIEPELLAPQWEFSMNHCYFDKSKRNKITGYYNLQILKEKLSDFIIRREKADVFDELPDIQEINVPIELSVEQAEMHSGFARALAPIISKKHKTIYDMQRIFQLLSSMRMVCNSTYLIDKETNISPKLDELKTILLDKLSIVSKKRKVIIFSEWKTMLHLISNMLNANSIKHVTLSGEVAVKNRTALIEQFENDIDSLVFLSTEAGGTGLNMQFADTVINFELPWNPAKKNQRFGRINRIGQKSSKLTAINMVALNSIEERIADGIIVKESLFDAVLNEGDLTEEVDFAAKGRSTFIDKVKEMIEPINEKISTEEEDEEIEQKEHAKIYNLFSEMEDENDIDESSEYDFPKDEKVTKEDVEKAPTPVVAKPEDIEATLNQGMQFLNGVFKMATGKELLSDKEGIKVDRETGEVVMKFKLPGF
ncbi:MAG: DEAD/DEAH box helicase [Melioribacteraceae bacterium]|nr:DEAD/DEAH box helicase [Melioribacteraceae bacterium]